MSKKKGTPLAVTPLSEKLNRELMMNILNNRNVTLYRSTAFLGCAADIQRQLTPGFNHIEAWSQDPDRDIWINHSEMTIVTYEGGNVDVEIFKSQEAYHEALEEIDEKYSEK